MAIVDTGTVIGMINQTKLRKDFDDMAKIDVPLKAEQAESREQTESCKASEPSAQPLSASYFDLLWLPITRSKIDFQQLYYVSSWISAACAEQV